MTEFLPSEFYLAQNYPNPFRRKTVIKYCVPYRSKVQITVFSTEGKELEKLVDEEKNPGTYEVEFSACHSCGSRNPESDAYYYRLESGDYKSEKTMEIIK